ncbi:MAG: hypothetical protein NTZ68_03915, partial [Candidatus Dependentiae bacterium]|nr:hypothetical protein [Candidatus Dependentiae bacterium]
MNKIYKFSIIFFLVPLLFLAGCTAKKFFQLGQTFDAGNIVPSVSISNDGRRISVGTGSSQVQIYELNNNPTSNNNVWAPLGAPITGVVAQLSGDGARVVVSDLTTVKMYTYSGVAWTQQGATLSLSVGSGFDTISINTDGTVVGFGQLSGNIARIYNFNGAAWTQLGATLTGSLVSLSVDGLKVAIGDLTNSTVKIYNYSGATWNQQGGTIMTGCVSVSLFNDTVAIGTVESGEGYVQVYEYKAGVWSLLGTRLQVASDRIGTTVSLTLQRDALDSLFPNYQVLTASSFPGNRLYSFFYNSLSRSWDLTEIPNGEILNSPFGRVSSSGILNKQVPVINDEGKITGTKTVYFSRFISSILPAKVFTSEVVEEPASVAETASPFPVNLARATISSGPGNPLPSLGVSTPAGINPFMALTNNQAAAQTQLSQQTFVYNGDSSLSFFFINVPGSPYNGKFFQCSNLQGALSFSNNSYQFRQTGSVTGTVYELDQTTVFASDITLTAGQFFNVSLTGTFDPKTNVLTVTDITGGTITAGTFTGGITITGTITNGSAFTVTVTTGTLNGLDIAGATFAGMVTSADGTYVYEYSVATWMISKSFGGTPRYVRSLATYNGYLYAGLGQDTG